MTVETGVKTLEASPENLDAQLTVLITTARSRGVSFVPSGNRVRIRPWRQLLPAEIDVINKHRPRINALVRAGAGQQVTVAASTTAAEAVPTVALAPSEIEAPSAPLEEQCRHGCGSLSACAELKAHHLDTWLVLHGRDGEALEFRRRRDDERYENTARLWELAGISKPDYL